MKKNRIRLTESQLHRVIKESVNKILEERYMSDDDIANQYSNFNITYLEIEPNRSGGWVGTLELEFPNADDIDFDSIVVDNFIVYDHEGKHIAFDRWYPDNVCNEFKAIIKNEINKKARGVY